MISYDFDRILKKYNVTNTEVGFENYDNLKKIEWEFTKGEGKFSISELSNVITYDTEANNGFRLSNGDIVGMDIDRYIIDDDYKTMIDNAEPQSLTWLWQIAVESMDGMIYVFLGQSFDTFKDFINHLINELRRAELYGGKGENAIKEEYDMADSHKRKLKFYIFVHNFGYDFQTHILNCYEDLFLQKKRGKGKRVFAKSSCSPMKANVVIDGAQVEFRDTYSLTHKSLRNWTADANLPVQKLDEDMLPDDFYLQVRVPYQTKLKDYELIYSINDVVCMVYGIKKFREEFGSLKDIPLTETGITRTELRKAVCDHNKGWSEKCAAIMKNYTFDEYNRLLDLFMGGWTHVNPLHSGTVFDKSLLRFQHIEFHAYDISSSYPASLCLYKFPVEQFEPVSVNDFDRYASMDVVNSDFRWYAKIKVKNLKSKIFNTFWSLSKCKDVKLPSNVIDKSECVDNGKLHSALEATITMTDVDYETFYKAYDYDIEVLELYVCKADFLPVEFIKKVLEYFNGKQMMKGDKTKDSEYKASKRGINACYGISAQRLANDEVDLINEDGTLKWETKHADGENNEEAPVIFYEQLNSIKPEKTFLMYQIAPWVTAWSRRRLFRAILQFDEDVWYCDTDSVKLTAVGCSKWFEEENKRIADRCDYVAGVLGIDPNLYNPVNPRTPNKNLRLGIWDNEGDICEFVAYRAKCYCYRTVKDNELHVTLAGLPSEAGVKHTVTKEIDGIKTTVDHGKIESIYDFKLHMIWNEKESFKSLSHYNTNQTNGVWIDRDGNRFDVEKEFGFYPKYGICIKPTTFKIERGKVYDDFLAVMVNGRVYGEINDIIKYSYL